jgi:hypothetical protein
MSLYVVAIGGTGARCVEAITHLAAAGLFEQERIQILFIDPDQSNGNLTRTRATIKAYQDCRQWISEGGDRTPWMQALVGSLEVWSPFHSSTNKSLGSFFNYESYQFNNSSLGHLFEVLYTKGEREAELDVGFRGRPAIGSAIMSQVQLDNASQEPWQTFIQDIGLDLGQSRRTKIFLCGSIFGGTGAAGFPTIGRLLRNKLERAGLKDSVKLGGLLMLPYFQFAVPPDQDPGAIYARPEQFLLNTEAALRYYKEQKIFDTIYLLGDQEPASVKQFSIGKNTQQNDPHFIELYAALSARHFLLSSDTKPVVLLSRQEGKQITWDDVPDKGTVKPALASTTRFAFLWFVNIAPELERGKSNIGEFQKLAPWFSKFFRPKGWFVGERGLPDLNEEAQLEAIKQISAWCESYLRWLGTIHYSGGEGRNVQLFRANLFLERNGAVKRDIDNFPQLVANSDGIEQTKTTTAQLIKEKLALQEETSQSGTAGLATALYTLCKL